MSARGRRRRALALIALAVVAGALAAARVRAREAELDGRVGPLVQVVVARTELRPGERLRDVRMLGMRAVPAAFAPPDALADPADAAGLEVAAAVPAGGYVTAGALGPPREERQPGPPLRRGERALELPVAGAAGIEPGARADVVVTAETGAGGGRAYVALEDVEVLAVAPGGSVADGASPPAADGPAADSAGVVATLRVTAREAVRLTAARAFARELRLLARPPGDRRPVGPATVASGGL